MSANIENKKNIIIINSSDTFEYRIDMVYKFLKSKGHKVKVITSDFMHIEKKRRTKDNKDYILLKTLAYKKNISISRILSHYLFAKKAGRIIKNVKFDMLYIVVPPNFQASVAKRYKDNPNVKIIMDIIDMWPESFPSNRTDKFPFTIWKSIRDKNLSYADLIITECDLYQQRLEKYLDKDKTKTVYWAHNANELFCKPDIGKLSNEKIKLCYLGSINNIVDIEKIGQVIKAISQRKNVELNIIGSGERKEELIACAKANGALVNDHGKVYDYLKKKSIMDECHYGINIMKDSICVGLSMKSIDYFECGLPIINNLSGDLGKIIDEKQCGINIYEDDWLDKLFELENVEARKQNASNTFKEMFAQDVFFSQMEMIFDENSSRNSDLLS